MTIRTIWGFLLATTAASALLAGCGGGTRQIRFQYDRPAAHPLQEDIKRIAVAPLRGIGAEGDHWRSKARQTLVKALSNSPLTEAGVKVLPVGYSDREGPFDLEPALAVSKAVSPDALLLGSVQVLKQTARIDDPYIDSLGKPAVRQIWTMNASTTLRLQLLRPDGQTIRSVEVTRNFDSQDPDDPIAQRKSASLWPPSTGDKAPSGDAEIRELIGQACVGFVQQISPTTIRVAETLMSGQPESLVDSANKLASQGEYPLAADLYRQALDAQPGQASVLYNLGLALEAMDQHKEAREKYAAASKIAANPRFTKALRRTTPGEKP